MLLSQAQKIQVCYRANMVVAVARGGLVPGRILADLLETPQLATLQVEFYFDVDETRSEPTLRQPLTLTATGKKILIVDDVADTGQSLQLVIRYLKEQGAAEVKTATLYYKPKSTHKPDYFEKETNNWVIFPWDTKETLRKILKRPNSEQQNAKEIAKILKAGLPRQLADKLLNNMQ
jgi:hypoxanthine phosphoribosyltransferase